MVLELTPFDPQGHQTSQLDAGQGVQLQGDRLGQHETGRQGGETVLIPRHATLYRT